jgi:hypothetical protein
MEPRTATTTVIPLPRVEEPASGVPGGEHDLPVAVDLAFGLGVEGARVGLRALRAGVRVVQPAARMALRPAVLPERYWPQTLLLRLADRGHDDREQVVDAVTRAFDALVPKVLDAVLDEVDLTALVLRRVDLDAIADGLDLDAAVARVDLDRIVDRIPIDHVLARIDVDEVAAELDVDAVLDRVDLIGMARYIIDGVDLPEIIRESTGSMASEGLRGVRMQSIDADERVSRLVDRVLLRRHGRRTDAPGRLAPAYEDGDAT